MSERSPRKLKAADRDRIQDARKQIIQCESIIRKVLAIHNCFEELRNLDSESWFNWMISCLGDGSIVNGSGVERQSPLKRKWMLMNTTTTLMWICSSCMIGSQSAVQR